MKSVEDLKKEFSKYFEVMNRLGIYSWITGGAIRDFFLDETPKDIDFNFENQKGKDLMRSYFLRKGFLEEDVGWRHCTLSKEGFKYDLALPNEMAKLTGDLKIDNEIKKSWANFIKIKGHHWDYDFTINAAAIDCNLEFYCHENFFEDLSKKQLIRVTQIDRWHVTNSRRLNKLLKKGFDIDRKNLISFLEDQEKAFQYRKELRSKEK